MRIGLVSFPNAFRNAGRAHPGAVSLCAGVLLIGVAGITAWLMLPEPSDAGDQGASPVSAIILTAQIPSDEAEPAQAAAKAAKDTQPPAVAAAPAAEAATAGVAAGPQAAPEPKPTESTAEKSPLDGLRIASQSWRRGGLGSKALVTLTLRNRNDFAVKDVEIACAFARRDGRPLTERKRLLAEPIAMKSRKTYSRMLIGFVNINANKAKCSVITASRL